MPKIWWVTGPNGLPVDNGRVVANTYEEADAILFYRLCHAQCPMGSTLEEASVCEEIEDSNILSTENST
jgi:hypothetical protein